MQTLSFGNRPIDLHPSIAGIRPRLTHSSLIQSVDHGQRLWFANDWIGEGLYSQYLWLDKLRLFDWRVFVAKKRTRQLIDLTTLWRWVILENRDHQVVKQMEAQQSSILDWWAIHKETREPRAPIRVPGYIE